MVLGKGEVRKVASWVGVALALGMGPVHGAQAQTFARPSATPATNDNHTNIEFGSDARYESNVAHTSDLGAAERHIEPSDERVSPDLTLDVQRLVGANKFSLQADGGYDFYRRNTRLNRERININPSAGLKLSICDVTVTGGYGRNQTDLADIASTGSVSLITNVESKLSGGVEMACGNEIGLRPMIGANIEHAVNSALLRQGFDRNTITYSAGLAYVHPSVGTLMAFGSSRKMLFINSLLEDGEHNGYIVKSLGGRLTRDTGARLRGWVEVTYVELDPRQAVNRRFSGLNWSADVTLDASSRVQAHVPFAREITSGAVADTTYHIDTTYGLDVKYALSGRLQLTLSGLVTQRSFSGSQGAAGVALISDHLYNNSATLTFAESEHLQFTLMGGYDRRQANASFYNYQSISVQTGVRFKL